MHVDQIKSLETLESFQISEVLASSSLTEACTAIVNDTSSCFALMHVHLINSEYEAADAQSQQAASDSGVKVCYEDSIAHLQQLIGRSSIRNGDLDSNSSSTALGVSSATVKQLPAESKSESNQAVGAYGNSAAASSSSPPAQNGSPSEQAGNGDANSPVDTQAGLPFVTSLPPLHLRLSFPTQYPSALPPKASISAAWLTPQQAQRLEGHLYKMWDDQGPGLPVCFTWLDWLQAYTMEHLGISSVLYLLPVAAGQMDLPEMQSDLTHQSSVGERSSPTGTLDAASQSADIQQGSRSNKQPGSQLQPSSHSPTSAAQLAASRKPPPEAPGSVASQTGNSHHSPASHVSGQANGDLQQSSRLGPFLADTGGPEDVSAAGAFAAADALLGHLLRYDAMREWDRYIAATKHVSLLAEVLH